MHKCSLLIFFPFYSYPWLHKPMFPLIFSPFLPVTPSSLSLSLAVSACISTVSPFFPPPPSHLFFIVYLFSFSSHPPLPLSLSPHPSLHSCCLAAFMHADISTLLGQQGSSTLQETQCTKRRKGGEKRGERQGRKCKRCIYLQRGNVHIHLGDKDPEWWEGT